MISKIKNFVDFDPILMPCRHKKKPCKAGLLIKCYVQSSGCDEVCVNQHPHGLNIRHFGEVTGVVAG